MLSPLALLSLLAAADPASAAAAPAAAPVTALPPDPPPVAEAPPTPPPPTVALAPAGPARELPRTTAFRLGLSYTRVFGEDGDLADGSLSTNAVGIDLAFPSSSYVRSHLGLGNQWESKGGYSARGFRIDLISFGYPISLVDSTVRLDLEPILTLVRGEIMFVQGGPNFLRMESGFGLDLSVTYRHWFLGVEPAVDFRYWVYSKAASQTGFGRIFPFRTTLGHEF